TDCDPSTDFEICATDRESPMAGSLDVDVPFSRVIVLVALVHHAVAVDEHEDLVVTAGKAPGELVRRARALAREQSVLDLDAHIGGIHTLGACNFPPTIVTHMERSSHGHAPRAATPGASTARPLPDIHRHHAPHAGRGHRGQYGHLHRPRKRPL